MLCTTIYTQEYINSSYAKIADQIVVYEKLRSAMADDPAAGAALSKFESVFFNNLVILLDSLFNNRCRTIELRDGNPLNEVRMIANAMQYNSYIFIADEDVSYSTEKSVLKYQFGDEISINAEGFDELFEAFFREIEGKYAEPELV